MLKRLLLISVVTGLAILLNMSSQYVYSHYDKLLADFPQRAKTEYIARSGTIEKAKGSFQIRFPKELKLKDKDEEIAITISFAGDCTLGTDESFPYINSFPYRLEKEGNDMGYFFKNVRRVFELDDLTLVNLENPFTNAAKKANKKFRFKGDPSYVNILKEGSVEMVNIANNHIYDYLEQGYKDTLDTLEKEGILYSGEGNIAYYQAKGITIGSVGYTGWDTSIKKKLLADIETVREKSDLVIASFHWGSEYSNYPNSVQLELGRLCIDKGVDVVVGHHPHVIQGIENYRGKYIVYSLGNFCFGGNRNPKDKDSFIFQNKFVFKNRKVEKNEGIIIPCRISSVNYVNDYQPTILKEKEEQHVLDRIYTYSNELKYGIKK